MLDMDIHELSKTLARIYSGKNRISLSVDERKVVKHLEDAGYLVSNSIKRELVGKIVHV
jgi:hypothetical protein